MKIYFITDGGESMGMGHVVQSTTVATAIKDKAEIHFITKSDTSVVSAIQTAGFVVDRLDSDEEIIKQLVKIKPDKVIFDKIDVDEGLARDIKRELKAKLIIFTNLTDANKYADVAITADIGSRFENIKYYDPTTNTRYYFGPKYWALRKEFHEYKNRNKPIPTKIDNILLIFGGSDPANLTSVVLEELISLNRTYSIKVVLGVNFKQYNTVLSVLERNDQKHTTVAIYRNVSNVAQMMYETDLTIASPGLSVFEALCVGTPVIVVPQDDLQRDTYKGFIRMIERDEIGKLGSMIDSLDFSYANSEPISRMQIGEGFEELIDEILN